jgi:organic radical activating enzyme
MGPCCTYRGDRPANIQNVNDYINSDWLKELQRKMLNSEKDSGCHNCWIKEDAGEDSLRLARNRIHGHVTTVDIERVYLSFGNICNKNCNICRPARSSIIAKEYKKLGSNHEIYDIDPNREIKQKDFSGMYLDNWENYIDALDRANTICLDGGEPFYTKQCTTILETLIKRGMTDKDIQATTNGSVTPYQYNLLSKFKRVDFDVSIDGINELYSLVRSPHDWAWWNDHHSIMVKNNVNRVYQSVIHCLNVHQLPEMLKYFISVNDNPERRFGLTTIITRPYLGTHIVPNAILEVVKNNLTDMMPLFRGEEVDNIANAIKHIEYSMNNKSELDEVNFRKFVDIFGPIKKLDYQSYLPWSIK